MEKIENIIFDLGGVILDIDYNLSRAAFEKLGVGHFDEMYSQANADKLFQNLETGSISEQDFFTELNKCTGLNLSAEEIKKAWNAMLLHFREESLKFLDEIQFKYNLYLLSNTNFIHIKQFRNIFHEKSRLKIFDEYFKRAFYSCEIGLRKPDAECYQYVINELRIEPYKTLFIDDSPHNVQAAKKAGMKTVHLTTGMKIENLDLIG